MPASVSEVKMKTGKGRLRAQAMLEFALALPIFLLVVYGIMEAGRAIFMYAGVTTAAKEAARYAAASGINADGNLHYQDCVAIRTAARNVGFVTTTGANAGQVFAPPAARWPRSRDSPPRFSSPRSGLARRGASMSGGRRSPRSSLSVSPARIAC